MKPFKYLEGLQRQIRGWLPKDPHLPTMQLKSKPKNPSPKETYS
jgi:hypothetical protein